MLTAGNEALSMDVLVGVGIVCDVYDYSLVQLVRTPIVRHHMAGFKHKSLLYCACVCISQSMDLSEFIIDWIRIP